MMTAIDGQAPASAVEAFGTAKALNGRAVAPEVSPFRFLQPAELMAGARGARYLIKPFVEADTINTWFGPPETLKSFLGIDAGLCVSHGCYFHGQPVKQEAVFYICGEGRQGIAKRVRGWLDAHGHRDLEAPFYVSSAPARLLDLVHATRVMEAAQALEKKHGQRPGLIIVDTLARNMGDGDENKDLGVFLSHVDEFLRVPFGAAVVLIHHSGHGDNGRERGDSKLAAGVDCRIRVEREKGSMVVVLNHEKSKDGAPWPPIALQARVVPLVGLEDNFGGEASTLVLERTEVPPKPETKPPKITAHDARLNVVLSQLSAKVGGLSVKRADWVAAAQAEGVEVSEDTFERRVRSLVNAGLVFKVARGIYRPVSSQPDAK